MKEVYKKVYGAASSAFLLIMVGLSGCATVQTDVANGQSLKQYKQAYIEQQPHDEFNIYKSIFWELNDMGYKVVAAPFKDPQDTDLNVTYTYASGWDLSRYLQAFQIKFVNAKTNQVVVTTSYRSRGIWRGVRDGRLEEAFNSIRTQENMPPTKQFGLPTQNQ